MHTLRKLRENENADAGDYERLLANNFVFHTPVPAYGVTDRKVSAAIFAAATSVKKGAFVGEWNLDDRKTLLHWNGEIPLTLAFRVKRSELQPALESDAGAAGGKLRNGRVPQAYRRISASLV